MHEPALPEDTGCWEITDRCLGLISQIRSKLADGTLRLAEKQKPAVEKELADIELSFRQDQPPLQMQTILPSSWLTGRWKAFERTKSNYYPRFGNFELNFASSIGSSDVTGIAGLSIMRSNGRKTWGGSKIMELVWGWEDGSELYLFDPEPDPLVAYPFVFQARTANLSNEFADAIRSIGEYTYSPIMGNIQQQASRERASENEGPLLESSLQMATWFNISCTKQERRTLLEVKRAPGLTDQDLSHAVQLQRLSLLLIWLLEGKKVPTDNHLGLDYFDIRERLIAMGLSEVAIQMKGEDESSHKDRVRRFVKSMSKHETLVASMPGGHAWKLKRPRGAIVLCLERLSRAGFDQARGWLTAKKATAKEIHVVVDQFDGPSLWKLMQLIGDRDRGKPVWSTPPNVYLLRVNSRTETFSDAVFADRNDAPPKTDNLLFAAAPYLDLVDPEFTLLWLARQSLLHIKRGDLNPELADYVPPALKEEIALEREQWEAGAFEREGQGASTTAAWCHGAAFLGLLFPPAIFFAPIVVWRWNRHKHWYIDQQGREAASFQMFALTCYVSLLVFGFSVPQLPGFGIFSGLVLVLLSEVVLVILAVLAVLKGRAFRYPVSLPIFGLGPRHPLTSQDGQDEEAETDKKQTQADATEDTQSEPADHIGDKRKKVVSLASIVFPGIRQLHSPLQFPAALLVTALSVCLFLAIGWKLFGPQGESPYEWRTWKYSTDRPIEARLLRRRWGHVHVESRSGSVRTYIFDNLSRDDRSYVEEVTRERQDALADDEDMSQ
jgi:hypothetical protein